jgi:tRNA-dihydrouridine synthase B
MLAEIIKHTSPIVLAPIAGFTDSPFRKIARRHGAGMVFTELLSAVGIVRNSSKTIDLLKFSGEERPIGIQIFGNDANFMAEAAGIVQDLKPDFIDINMGCCSPKVCHSGSGAGLLRNLDLLGAIASGVAKRVSIPVSAKIRIGIDEKRKNYLEVIKILEDSGISFVTVHARTQAQAYSGRADWDIIMEITDRFKIPIIGNGDIMSKAQADEKMTSSGCAAVMIGRAALGNPWIFNGREPSLKETKEQIIEHIDMMLEHYGDYGIILSRKHLVKYIHGIKNAAHAREALVHATKHDEIVEILNGLI